MSLVRRSIDGAEFAPPDTVGARRFTDATVPAGTHTVAYTIQAKRGDQHSSFSASLTVRFGRQGFTLGGESVIASVSSTPLRERRAA